MYTIQAYDLPPSGIPKPGYGLKEEKTYLKD
jgi:hypothetical protein